MNIYVNEEKIDYQPLFPLTWGNFFQKLLQDNNYIPKDHGIVDIILDGNASMEVMTDNTDQMVPEDIGEIRISTKDSISITRNGLEKVSNLIESMKAEITGAADLYREGDVKNASGKVARVMEAFKPMINFIQSVGISFTMNFDELMFNPNTGQSLREKIETFLGTFDELVKAQAKRDYVEVADYLEYQLLEDMDDWNKVVSILLQEVEASAANSA